MLATMSIFELEAFAAEILPARRIGFPPDDWRLVLAKQIYQAWGLKDPTSACLSRTGGWGLGLNVFNDWLRRDPEAAAAFCEQTRLSREMDPLAKSMHQSQLNQQALTDLQGASKSLNDLDPNTRAAMMVGWARMFANDPAKRQELANLLVNWTDPKLGTYCLKSLISEFPKRSPSEAAAFVENLAVSESVKEQLKSHMVTNLTFYGHLPQAATLSAGLEDSIERIRRMRWVKEIWDQRDPKQACE
jgi:hypothetical protein